MPDRADGVQDPGLLVAVGRSLVLSGVLTLVGALVAEGEWARGASGHLLGIDHPVSFLLCVLSVVLWLNGAVLWSTGRRRTPARVEAGRDDWA